MVILCCFFSWLDRLLVLIAISEQFFLFSTAAVVQLFGTIMVRCFSKIKENDRLLFPGSWRFASIGFNFWAFICARNKITTYMRGFEWLLFFLPHLSRSLFVFIISKPDQTICNLRKQNPQIYEFYVALKLQETNLGSLNVEIQSG